MSLSRRPPCEALSKAMDVLNAANPDIKCTSKSIIELSEDVQLNGRT